MGLKIFKRGNKLSLRGMMPAKPKSGKAGLSQQILSLGLYANAAGIKLAERQALKISGLIALKEFDWGDYIISSKGYEIESAGFWIDKFEADYFNKRDRNSKTETTWKDYCKVFNRFDKSQKLTAESLLEVVLQTTPDSRSRKRACTYTKCLARFAEIEFDPSEYKGNYSADAVEIRDIPSDELIQQWRDRFPVKHGLRYAFGLLAAYGLRPYELFHIDLESIKKPPGHLRIVESKSGKKTERLIWCLFPEWYELWDLGNTKQPFVNYSGKTNSDLGNRVGDALRKYGFYKAYNLRHAWAIRAIAFMPIELASSMMDHDISVHKRTYQRFISQSDYDRFYKLMMSQPNRPKPPTN